MSSEQTTDNVEQQGFSDVTIASVLAQATIIHSREYDYINGHPLTFGGYTIVYVPEENNGRVLVTAGVAKCSAGDQYSKKIGVKIAVERLIEDPILLSLNLGAKALVTETSRNGSTRVTLPVGTFISDPLAEVVIEQWESRRASRAVTDDVAEADEADEESTGDFA